MTNCSIGKQASVDKLSDVPYRDDRRGEIMMRFRQNVCFIGLVVLIYSALLVMATGCALAHADRSQNHRHHHSEEGPSNQNLLCAWACQVVGDATEASEPPSAVTEILVGPIDLTPYQFIHSSDFSTVPTPAPPSIPFVRLG